MEGGDGGFAIGLVDFFCLEKGNQKGFPLGRPFPDHSFPALCYVYIFPVPLLSEFVKCTKYMENN